MAWWQIILLIIQYGPKIVEAVKFIWELIEKIFERKVEQQDYHGARYFRKMQRQRLRVALRHYRKTGDDSKLEIMKGNLQDIEKSVA